MSDGMAALFWGVITFSLLIVLHEGGHFLFARLFGVKVHEFMVGLPGPAIRFHGKKTTYGVTAIPLGGYVRIAGMEPGPEDPLLGPALAAITRAGEMDALELGPILGISGNEADKVMVTLADWDAIEISDAESYRYRSKFAPELADDPEALLDRARSVTYRALPLWKRIVVLSAGVVTNLLTAVLVFTVTFSIFGYYKETTQVNLVLPGTGAFEAGMMAGDVVKAIDDTEITAWNQLVTRVKTYDVGDTVVVKVTRDGKPLDITVKLSARPEGDGPYLGLQPVFAYERPSPWEALAQSIGFIGLTFAAIVAFFNPETFQTAVSQSSSVIGASYFAAEAAKSSPLDYASIVAVLSLSLGVINIIPIPPLDGGKVMMELVERGMKRQIPRNVSLGISAAGTLLLFALIGYLMYADVVRFIVNG